MRKNFEVYVELLLILPGLLAGCNSLISLEEKFDYAYIEMPGGKVVEGPVQ